MGAATFQEVVRLGLKNERSRREDRGAEGAERVGSGEGMPPSPADLGVTHRSHLRLDGKRIVEFLLVIR